MRQPQRFAAILLLSLPFAAACAGKGQQQPLAEQNSRMIYPDLPPTICQDAPAPPLLDASDNEWAAYKWTDHQAGQDCREKLKAVHDTKAKWPAPPAVASTAGE